MSQVFSNTAAKVEEAILNHEAFTENFEINVVENGGIVTLLGKVPSSKYLQLAEEIAQGVKNVSGVINQMEVDSSMEEESGLLDLDDETQVPPARSGPHARY